MSGGVRAPALRYQQSALTFLSLQECVRLTEGCLVSIGRSCLHLNELVLVCQVLCASVGGLERVPQHVPGLRGGVFASLLLFSRLRRRSAARASTRAAPPTRRAASSPPCHALNACSCRTDVA